MQRLNAMTSARTEAKVTAANGIVTLLRRIASNFILQRLVKAFATIFVVISLTFFIIRLMPANPIDVYVHELIDQFGMSYDEARNHAASLFAISLDEPLHEQYFDYLGALSRGDLGTSYRSKGTPVSSIILKFLPWTIFSVGVSLLISFTLGILLGMIMAYKRESVLDHTLSAFGSIVSSVPNYLIGMLIIVFLGVQWKLLPITAMRGSMTPGIEPGLTLSFIQDIFFHAALPIATYVLTTIGGWMLLMKSSTISTLEEDYVTAARARGLGDQRITTAYVGRNAALPLFTQFTISVGFIVGGSVLIESIFVYQGVGLLLVNSIYARDYPVMQGVFLVITSAVVIANLLADLLYGRLDPRISIKGD